MGCQARCACRWADEVADCTVLVEAGELIVRGGMRRRVALSAITDLVVADDALCFRAGGEQVSLCLGHHAAVRWAAAMKKPQPTLAKKLGISSESRVLVIGEVDDADEGLKAALAEAGSLNGPEVDLIVLCAESPAELSAGVKRVPAGKPVWVVYAKGKGTVLGEGLVRELLRDMGYIDTKVASVSTRLTALRFVRRAG